jgi:hypothetical protein
MVEQWLEVVECHSSLSPRTDGPRFEWFGATQRKNAPITAADQCDDSLTMPSRMSMAGRIKGFSHDSFGRARHVLACVGSLWAP